MSGSIMLPVEGKFVNNEMIRADVEILPLEFSLLSVGHFRTSAPTRSPSVALSNGNRTATVSGGLAQYKGVRAEAGMLVGTGRYYWEMAYDNDQHAYFSIQGNAVNGDTAGLPGSTYNGFGFYASGSGGFLANGGDTTPLDPIPSLAEGTIVGIVYDTDTGGIWISIDGEWVSDLGPRGEPLIVLAATIPWYPGVWLRDSEGDGCSVTLNAVGPFVYPPSEF